MTEQHKRRISEAKKGKTPNWRNGHPRGTLGKIAWNKAKVSLECQQCGSRYEVSPYRASISKFCSKACVGRSRGGVKSPHWQGGITPINLAIRNSERYKMWRLAVYERDCFTCVKCGVAGVKLEADHIKLFSKHPELRFDISNGQTLCKPCHKEKTRIDLSTKLIEALN
jgi:5-methylcytosine-specific restriction endonuclease McrA